MAERFRPGFTLLEVMAAVAILGMVTVVLVRLSAEGALAEGDARRRMDASLLADAVLQELEGGWHRGAPVEPGRRESERGGYRVVVDVAPFRPTDFGLDALLEAPPAPPGRREPSLPTPPDAALLAPSGQRAAPLSVVTVVVSWPQGVHERAVTRTTFVLDRQAAAPLLEPLAGSEGGGGRGPTDAPGGVETLGVEDLTR